MCVSTCKGVSDMLDTNRPVDGTETDELFLERQFRVCVLALERVHALSPGEFDSLARTPARTDDERAVRARHHEDIARSALRAMQQGLLREEEFNLWSGRRKEAGQPVKFRFERAYSALCTPAVSCRRGALTGIVRAYQRQLDELLGELTDATTAATTPEALLAVERRAVEAGIIEFETYLGEAVEGWPTFPRSTGRFRGAAALREVLELRQRELPMTAELAERHQVILRGEADADDDAQRNGGTIQRAIASVARLFNISPQ